MLRIGLFQSEAPNNREGYPLRPELVESLMYLFQATKDHNLLEMAADIVVSIQHSAKTECGYATVRQCGLADLISYCGHS